MRVNIFSTPTASIPNALDWSHCISPLPLIFVIFSLTYLAALPSRPISGQQIFWIFAPLDGRPHWGNYHQKNPKRTLKRMPVPLQHPPPPWIKSFGISPWTCTPCMSLPHWHLRALKISHPTEPHRLFPALSSLLSIRMEHLLLPLLLLLLTRRHPTWVDSINFYKERALGWAGLTLFPINRLIAKGVEGGNRIKNWRSVSHRLTAITFSTSAIAMPRWAGESAPIKGLWRSLFFWFNPS